MLIPGISGLDGMTAEEWVSFAIITPLVESDNLGARKLMRAKMEYFTGDQINGYLAPVYSARLLAAQLGGGVKGVGFLLAPVVTTVASSFTSSLFGGDDEGPSWEDLAASAGQATGPIITQLNEMRAQLIARLQEAGAQIITPTSSQIAAERAHVRNLVAGLRAKDIPAYYGKLITDAWALVRSVAQGSAAGGSVVGAAKANPLWTGGLIAGGIWLAKKAGLLKFLGV